MRTILSGVLIVCLCGCATKIEISRTMTSVMRRMPQVNRIDTGVPLSQGRFAVSGSVLYAVKPPGYMHTTDSSFESHSSPSGDQVTIVGASEVFCYETRLMVSGDGMYAFTPVLSSGVSLDASLGGVQAASANEDATIMRPNVEGSVFLRFARQFGRVAVAIRPEFVLAGLYGDQMTLEVTDFDSSLARTATDRQSHFLASVRSSSVFRVDALEQLSAFLGFQVKTQPFFSAPEDVDQDMAFGLYSGVDVQLGHAQLAPFVAVPLGSVPARHRSPACVGLQLMYVFGEGP